MTQRKRYAVVGTGGRAGMFVDAITSKPMTTDSPKLQAIYNIIEKTGRSLRVTFNYRYTPTYTQFRQLVIGGKVRRPCRCLPARHPSQCTRLSSAISQRLV
jgi:predicted dehydrogenase